MSLLVNGKIYETVDDAIGVLLNKNFFSLSGTFYNLKEIEAMPPEHVSYFNQYYDTEHWTKYMWRYESDRVLTICKDELGRIQIDIAVTHDGHWFYGTDVKKETLAWMPINIYLIPKKDEENVSGEI